MVITNLFLGEIYNFLKTVTITNPYFATLAQTKELDRLRIDVLPDNENPYYLNLLGIYGPTDERMMIKSLDYADTEIEFSKENLALHPKTAFAYSIGNDWYDRLLKRYPNQSDLIKLIRYPIKLQELTDLETPTGAPDSVINELMIQKTIGWLATLDRFTLIGYDVEQLEPQEVSSLLEALIKHLDMFRIRWDVPAYDYEHFYSITNWGLLWSLLPNVLLSQRVGNLRTSAVHSEAIWEYLKSNGIGDYRDILTHEQQLFLYKNMRYLIKTRGKDGTLSILADNLLKAHRVTLRSKKLLLDTEDFTSTVRPNVNIISSDIRNNTTASSDADKGVETVEQIYRREYLDGLEPIDSMEIASAQEQRFKAAQATVLPTKLVELQKIEIYSGNNNLFMKLVVDTLLYRASLDHLNYNVIISPPDTEEAVLLGAKEALALLIYCTGRAFQSHIVLTSVLLDNYLGFEIVTESGEVVVLSEVNKLDHLDSRVLIRMPYKIPTNAIVRNAYKNTFPNDLDNDFVYSGVNYGPVAGFDINAITQRIRTNVNGVSTANELMDLVNDHSDAMLLDADLLYGNGNSSFHIAFELLYHKLLVEEDVTLDLHSQFSNYADWFKDDVQLQAITEQYDNSDNPQSFYAKFADTLLLALLPLNRARNVLFSAFTVDDFKLMRQLFIQLCSYNISFLDTERTKRSYIKLQAIVVKDQREAEITKSSSQKHPDIDVVIQESYYRTTPVDNELVSHSVINSARTTQLAYHEVNVIGEDISSITRSYAELIHTMGDSVVTRHPSITAVDLQPSNAPATFIMKHLIMSPDRVGSIDGPVDFVLNGYSITLNNNSWVAYAIEQTIELSTVIEFEFTGVSEGPIVGIGAFDTDSNTEPLNNLMQFYGSDLSTASNKDYINVYRSVEPTTMTITINIGEFYQGDFNYIWLVSSGGVATFNNIKIYNI